MNTAEAEAEIEKRRLRMPVATDPTGAADETKRPEIGWWDVPRLPFHLLRTLWSSQAPWVRSALRIVTWIVLLTAFVLFIPLAVRWKSGQAWEDFLQKFVTSPAAAGTAAVLAAIIAAVTFSRGLQHTKAEARDKAWWEKFEWVTDRIVPKDPKQERLANGLALLLLRSLEDISVGLFQREAVAGIRETYIQGKPTDLFTATPGEIRAQLREVQTFANSSWHSGELTFRIRSYSYKLAASLAMREAWQESELQLEPPAAQPAHLDRRSFGVDAVLKSRRYSALIHTKYSNSVNHRFFKPLLGKNLSYMDSENIRNLVFVSSEAEERMDRLHRHISFARSLDPELVRLLPINWSPADGAAELRQRVERALDAAASERLPDELNQDQPAAEAATTDG